MPKGDYMKDKKEKLAIPKKAYGILLKNLRDLEEEINPVSFPDEPDVQRLHDRTMHYFNFCIERNMPPSIAGLASSLEMETGTLRRWELGTRRQANSHGVMIKRAKRIVEQFYIVGGTVGDINVIWSIYYSKNCFGMRDQVDIVHSADQSMLANLPTPGEMSANLPDLQLEDAIEVEYEEIPDSD